MNRISFVISLSLLLVPAFCRAQQVDVIPGVELRLGMGAVPEKASDLLMVGRGHSWWVDYDASSPLGSYTLSSIYHDYNGASHSTNALGVDALVHVNGKWDVGCGLYVNHLWYDKHNGVTEDVTGRYKAAAVYIVPTYRRYYLNRSMIRLYGQASVGVVKYIHYDTLKYEYRDSNGDLNRVDNSLKAIGEFVPLGVELGRELFGFFEVGFGQMYSGVCLGIGYDF